MLLMIFALYLLLAVPVYGSLLAAANGTRATVRVSAHVCGVNIRYDASAALDESKNLAATELKKRKKSGLSISELKKRLKSPLFLAVRQALRLDRLEVRMCIGLEEAWSTALAVGGIRAALLSLLSCLPPVDRAVVEVAPDFTAPCLLVHARCIFSVTLGDIMLAAAKAAMKKRRKEGA